MLMTFVERDGRKTERKPKRIQIEDVNWRRGDLRGSGDQGRPASCCFIPGVQGESPSELLICEINSGETLDSIVSGVHV